MPYSIKTKDGIVINNIPDDVAKDSDVLKTRVAEIRKQREIPVSEPADLAVEKRSLKGLVDLPGQILSKLEGEVSEMKKKGWENMAPNERAKLMVMAAPAKFAESLGVVSQAAPSATARLAPAMVGQKIGQMTRFPGAGRFGGAAGGVLGEYIAGGLENKSPGLGDYARAAWLGATQPQSLVGAGPQATAKAAAFNMANVVGSAVVRAFLNGEPLPDNLKEQATMALLATGGQRALDSGATARAARIKQASEAPAMAKMEGLYKAGVPISTLGKVLPTKVEESVNKLGRKFIGVPEDFVLTPKNIENHINGLYEVYDDIGKKIPNGSGIVSDIKQARRDAKKAYIEYNASEMRNNPDPAKLEKARGLDATVDQLESLLENQAILAGEENLIKRFKEDRIKIAKAHTLDRALDPYRGVVEAKEFHKLKERGFKITDEGNTIADVYGLRQLDGENRLLVANEKLGMLRSIGRAAQQTQLGQFLTVLPRVYQESPDLAAQILRLGAMQSSAGVAPFFNTINQYSNQTNSDLAVRKRKPKGQ